MQNMMMAVSLSVGLIQEAKKSDRVLLGWDTTDLDQSQP